MTFVINTEQIFNKTIACKKEFPVSLYDNNQWYEIKDGTLQ